MHQQVSEGGDVGTYPISEPMNIRPAIECSIKEEEDTSFMDNLESERRESISHPIDIPFSIQEEEGAPFMDHLDSTRSQNISPSTAIEFSIKEGEDAYFKDRQDSEGIENSCDYTDIPFNVNEEETYFTDNQDSERKQGIHCLTGDGAIHIKIDEDCKSSIARPPACKAPAGIDNVTQSSEMGRNSACQLWSKSNQRLRGEKTTSSESGFRDLKHSDLQLRTPKAERAFEFSSQESYLKNAKLPRHQTNTQHNSSQHTCSQCEKSFSSVAHLLTHQNMHMRDNSFQYTECEKNVSLKGPLGINQRTHIPLYQCSECEKSFSRKNRLSVHQKIHFEERPYQCSECEKSFTNKRAYFIHQKKHTGQKQNVNCCDKSLSQKVDCFYSKKTDTRAKRYQCSECEKCFRNMYALERHNRVHTGERPYKCNECGKAFCQSCQLIRHQKIHFAGEQAYPCTECEKSFSDRRACINHQRIHTGEKPYACTECSKRFSEQGNLKRHYRTHTGERPYQCAECKKNFTQKRNLIFHQRIHTGQIQNVTGCDKSLIQKAGCFSNKKAHIRENEHPCTKCEKSFCNKYSLARHQATHMSTPITAVQRYPCTECGKSFNQRRTLIIHQRIHTGEKPFQCTSCKKSFSQKVDLTRHQMIHTKVTSVKHNGPDNGN